MLSCSCFHGTTKIWLGIKQLDLDGCTGSEETIAVIIWRDCNNQMKFWLAYCRNCCLSNFTSRCVNMLASPCPGGAIKQDFLEVLLKVTLLQNISVHHIILKLCNSLVVFFHVTFGFLMEHLVIAEEFEIETLNPLLAFLLVTFHYSFQRILYCQLHVMSCKRRQFLADILFLGTDSCPHLP